MTMLTDDEISDIYEQPSKTPREFARSIEQAVIAKLREQNEPVAFADPLDIAKDGNTNTFIVKHASEWHEGLRFKTELFTHLAPSAPCLSQSADCATQRGLSLTAATQAPSAPVKQTPFAWHSPTEGLSYENHYSDNVPLYSAPSAPDVEAKYNELLMAVGRKFKGGSRHATALNYIRKMEEPSVLAAARSGE